MELIYLVGQSPLHVRRSRVSGHGRGSPSGSGGRHFWMKKPFWWAPDPVVGPLIFTSGRRVGSDISAGVINLSEGRCGHFREYQGPTGRGKVPLTPLNLPVPLHDHELIYYFVNSWLLVLIVCHASDMFPGLHQLCYGDSVKKTFKGVLYLRTTHLYKNI